MKYTVLLDNGHGSDTKGKCSPDGKFREYKWARKMTAAIKAKLEAEGINVYMVCPEETDTSLPNRVKRINNYCAAHKDEKKCMVSVHVNAAAGDGKWHDAAGWCTYSTRGVTISDKLAECLYSAAEKHLSEYAKWVDNGKLAGDYGKVQRYMRTDTSDGDKDIEADFYIIKKANCAAVLVENMFQDTKKDVEYLESEAGFNALVNVHVDGIKKYFGLV